MLRLVLCKIENAELGYIYVGRMFLALLREREVLFRRHAGGTDTGEYSTIDFTCCPPLATTGVYGGTKTCRKRRDRCGDPLKDQDVLSMFYLYTCFYR